MSDLADLMSVISGVIVVVGAGYAFYEYSILRWFRRRALTAHLKRELERRVDKGQRTVVQLMSDLRMTEQQIIEAGFGARDIQPVVTVDERTRHAVSILFQYIPDGRSRL